MTGSSSIFDEAERRRIVTYLRLLDSGSGGEVEMAAKKAREILKAHNLSFGTLADHPEWLAGAVSGTQFESLKQKLDDALDANEALAAQNDAVLRENERLRRPGVKEKFMQAAQRLGGMFTPAAAVEENTAAQRRKGFLRSMFAAAAPGILGAGTIMMGADPVAVILTSGIVSSIGVFGFIEALEIGAGSAVSFFGNSSVFLTGAEAFIIGAGVATGGTLGAVAIVFGAFTAAASFALAVAVASENLNTWKVAGGTLAGMALSVALAFSAATHYGSMPDKAPNPVSPQQGVERQLAP